MPRSEGRSVVWVVDDSRTDAHRAERVLSSSYDVEVFHDAAVVLERLTSSEPPDALVLDWLMPDVSGIDVVHFIRKEVRLKRLGVLLLTAQQATEQIVEGLSAGANDYVSKPYAPEELRARVAALVRTAGLWARVERAEHTVRVLLDSHPEGLLAVEPGGDILYANDVAMRFLRTNDVCGRSLEDVLPRLVSRMRQGARGTMEDLEIEGRVLAPHFSEASLDFGKIVLIALRDVTEERRMVASRVDFYSMIAHDLRTPLNAIRLRCELMRQGVLSDPEQLDEGFRKISDHTTALVQLINDFLEIGRMERDSIMRLERVELTALLREAVELLEPLARQKQIALSLHTPEQAEVLGDRGRLSQVLANLLGNALKFTPSEGHVDAQIAFADEHTVEISVADDGPGIPPEEVPYVFERYRRVGTSGELGGSGLGLSIVRQVVDAHEGTLGVSSQPGHGSRFWIRLPQRAD